MDLIYGIPKWLLSKLDKTFARIRTQVLTINQQFILDGFGFEITWHEPNIATSDRRFAQITVPAGYYLAADYRLFNTDSENVFYRVYPEGTYTVSVVGTAVPVNSLRSDSGMAPPTMNRVTLSVLPDNTETGGDWFVQEVNFGISGSSSGSKASGALSPESVFRLVEPGNYLLEIDNQGAGVDNAQVNIIFGLLPAESVSPSLV